MHIVLDTNVLVSALLSQRGASYKILSLLRSNKFELHLSVPLVCEYEDVLKRSEAAYTISSTHDEIDALLDIICNLGIQHKVWYLWRPMLSDPKDDFIAELAITAQVNYIVTHNGSHFKRLAQYGIPAISPKEFLGIIGELS